MVGDAGDPGGGGFLAEEFGNWSGSRLRPLQQLDPVALVIGELAAGRVSRAIAHQLRLE